MSYASQLFVSLKGLASQGSPPGMLQDLLRLTMQRVMRDKILLGLVIIGLLGVFVGGFSPGKEDKSMDKAALSASTSLPPSKSKASSAYSASDPLDPALATDFVKWWLTGAMDYSSASAAQSHASAIHWMTPEAERSFEANFWTPELASSISEGRIVGTFQPLAIQAEALNPDGTVVVGILGTLVLGPAGRPINQEIIADILVSKERSGLRVAGLYNRSAAPTSSSVY